MLKSSECVLARIMSGEIMLLYARYDVLILHFAVHKSLCTGTRTSSNKHINVNEVEHRQAGEIRSFRKLCTPHTPCCVIFCILSHICDISRIFQKSPFYGSYLKIYDLARSRCLLIYLNGQIFNCSKNHCT